MDLTLMAIVIGVLVFVALFAVVYAFGGRRSNLEERLSQPTSGDRRPRFSWRDVVKRSERVFKPLGDMIPRSPEEMSRQEKRLVKAGIRHKDGPVLFYGAKLCLAVTILITFGLTGFMGPTLPSALRGVAISVFLGAAIPDIWLRRKGRNRQERIQLAIPDVLDLTVVCVEAGLGLDQSLMRIGQETSKVHSDLSDELRLYNLEVNAGRSRADALRHLAARTEVDDLKALTAVLIQTDRFGTGIAQSLRVFSDSLRTRRRQRAEERGAKTAIKMVPVLVFFIFPAIFIMVVFPAFLAIIRDLLPKLGGK
ncbi:MAG: type II secretion system F family protein [Blastocatellia bacterium]